MRPYFYILDGHALSYQAFYALTSLHHSNGQPTNAIFGFIHSIYRILQTRTPDYLAVCFDMPAKTFRHHIFSDYKANRKPMPDDLQPQIPIIKEFLKIMQIPIFTMEGYEGDDIIATLACRALDSDNLEICVVSPDKDMAQLLSERVHLFDSKLNIFITPQKIISKYGVAPNHLANYFGLVGDSSDNIPGVPGIGPKRAMRLLKDWPTLEILYENLRNVHPIGLRKKLEENKEQAFLSRGLFYVNKQVPIEFNLEMCRVRQPDKAQLIEFYQRLEFRSFLKELLSQQTPSTSPNQTFFADDTTNIHTTPDNMNGTSIESAIDNSAHGEPKTSQQSSTGATENASTPLESAEKKSPQAMSSIWLLENANEINELVSLVSQHQEIVIAHDSQNIGFNVELLGIALKWGQEKIAYIPSKILGVEQWKLLEKILNTGPQKIGHDLKLTAKVLLSHNIVLSPIGFDTMLAAYLLSSGTKEYTINDLCIQYFTCPAPVPPAPSIVGGFAEFEEDMPSPANYWRELLERIAQLHQVLLPLLQKNNLFDLFQNLELPLIPILVEMEKTGILIDTVMLKACAVELQVQINKLEQEIFQLAGVKFNISSSPQLAMVLFDKLQLPHSKKNKTGGYSTNAETLETLAPLHPVPGLVLQYRQASKLLGTYAESLPNLIRPSTGRIYTTFHQTGTVTGRLSSSDPNLQNIPIRSESGEKIRRAFIASPGCKLVTADYSQMELRVLAHFSQDPILLQAFHNDQDVHSMVASSLFGISLSAVTPEQRRIAKTVNFGIIYGKTPYGLSQELHISMHTAKEFIDSYFTKFSRVAEYIEEVLSLARELHYVTTIANRRRYIYDINASNTVARKLAERMAFNTVMQGSAADIVKLAMIGSFQARTEKKLPFKILLQIHDELVVEAPEDICPQVGQLLAEQMKKAGSMLSVPVKIAVHYGTNWQEAHA